MDYASLIGFFAAGVSIATMSMKTMVPLRIVGICSNITFVIYGLLIWSLPLLALHAVLLPLNVYRLREMLKLIRDVRTASEGSLSMDWLRAYATERAIVAGDILFRKGDAANEMFLLVAGRLRLRELDIELEPGVVVGEMGLLAPGRERTQTLECIEDGEVLRVTYDKIRELYFQNPSFGFYFLQLTTSRLFENIGRLETRLAEREREVEHLHRKAAE
ncbi:MAG: cyclic nucleotide-binding domain-containing protein [Bauldia sp.]|uniref:Crp/Fnr family transcriptional regulator n=1 Tax=Bauldia sp. TaxID=2575872 RepID=UPI001DAC6534|nr:cyclic nucleotide-binding domain-containing protein [Bauldia sp.]MCB1495830.1 cyclic nucleotide-binding domain-containing protein [Bauldia sp.]